MDSVYVVIRDRAYEGSEVVAAFADEARADLWAMLQNRTCDANVDYGVEKLDLDRGDATADLELELLQQPGLSPALLGKMRQLGAFSPEHLYRKISGPLMREHRARARGVQTYAERLAIRKELEQKLGRELQGLDLDSYVDLNEFWSGLS